jgi:hypothetical protein
MKQAEKDTVRYFQNMKVWQQQISILEEEISVFSNSDLDTRMKEFRQRQIAQYKLLLTVLYEKRTRKFRKIAHCGGYLSSLEAVNK